MQTNETVVELKLLRLAAGDNVLIARSALRRGQAVMIENEMVTLALDIPEGFKIASRNIAPSEKIVKYGAPIGSATRAIAKGEMVHLQNMRSDYIPTYTRKGDAPHAS